MINRTSFKTGGLSATGGAALVSAAVIFGAFSPAAAFVVNFNNYVSPTINDLTNEFNQTETGFPPTPYIQSPTGGISGGSVTSVSGLNYQATAVYNQNSFNLSTPGASVNLSIDMYYNGQVQPLAPGANAVRSFRLGGLDSVNSAFETFGDASAYIEGDYSFTSQQMILIARSETTGPVTSIGLAQVPVAANNWYRLDATITNQGNNQILLTELFFDLGPNGTATAVLLSTADWSTQNVPIANLGSAYAGFSALADGGISQIDNFTVPDVAPMVVSHDFNGDGKSDILWRDTAGDVGMWMMHGSTISRAWFSTRYRRSGRSSASATATVTVLPTSSGATPQAMSGCG